MQENINSNYNINAYQQVEQPFIENNNEHKNLYSKLLELKKNISEGQDLNNEMQNTNSSEEYENLKGKLDKKIKEIDDKFNKLKKIYNDELDDYIYDLRNLWEKNHFCNSLVEILNSNYDYSEIDLENKIKEIEEKSNEEYEDYYNKNLEYLNLKVNKYDNNLDSFKKLENKINIFKNLDIQEKLKQEIEETKDALLTLIKNNKNLNNETLKYITNFLSENKIFEENELQNCLNDRKINLKNKIKKEKENKIVLKNEIKKTENKSILNKFFEKKLYEIEEDLNKLDDYNENLDKTFANYEKKEKILKDEIKKLTKELNYYKSYCFELENMINKLKLEKNTYKNSYQTLNKKNKKLKDEMKTYNDMNKYNVSNEYAGLFINDYEEQYENYNKSLNKSKKFKPKKNKK